ncbi:MAG: hypothetical protein P1P63_03455 [Treponemataceae bacterium]
MPKCHYGESYPFLDNFDSKHSEIKVQWASHYCDKEDDARKYYLIDQNNERGNTIEKNFTSSGPYLTSQFTYNLKNTDRVETHPIPTKVFFGTSLFRYPSFYFFQY